MGLKLCIKELDKESIKLSPKVDSDSRIIVLYKNRSESVHIEELNWLQKLVFKLFIK